MNPSQPVLNDVVVRLDSLESQNRSLARQNRWMKRLAVGGLLLIGALVFLGQARTSHADDPKAKKVVEANEFLVKDDAGKTRMTLKGGELLMNNEDGDLRLALYTNKTGGSGILVFDANDQKRQISIMRTKEGFMSFGVNDANGKTRVMLATRPDGKPILVLQDENQKSFFGQAQP